MKKIISFAFLTMIVLYVFGIKTYSLDLENYSAYHYKKLCEITDFKFENLAIKIHEYDNLVEFRTMTGGSFFIKGFTNSRGTFIQSRNLLKEEFKGTVVHEMLHSMIRSQYPVPPWFEEGLVCVITEEFSNIEGISAMDDVEHFIANEAENNWELVSYCLGCIKKVKEILGIE